MELNRRSVLVILGLVAILLIGAFLTYVIYLSPTGFKARQHADLSRTQTEELGTYTSLSGESFDFTDYRDGILVVNIWASWSPYSKTDHEILERIQNEYGEGIKVVALNRMEAKETAEAYLATIGKKEGIEYIIDTTDHFFTTLEGYAMPETIIFDEVGNEYFRKRGVLNEAELRDVLNQLSASK